ncbi:hypothetical protein BHE74_00050047 [Ensete ventricosum]|nr:hypothetical protein BHE74_00050047 [Ensete ventricosum]
MRLLSTQPAQHPTLTIASMATATLCAIVAVALFYSGAYTLPQADLAKRSAIASGRSENDAVGNSPRVHRELAKGIGSLPGWPKGVRWKKTETHRKIIGGSRKACRELGRS